MRRASDCKFFVQHLLADYDKQRNQPTVDGSSRLSPYLHFGHIGPTEIALAVDAAAKKHASLKQARDSFFNELLVWRELAVNFVKYTPNYDSAECAEPWARQSLAEHAHDPREWTYTLEQLERGETHDELWNASQLQMVHFGWMHNYMRMYWGKKILEWSRDPATAFAHAVALNDKYQLDGRDPNGYAGIAWAIVGNSIVPGSIAPSSEKFATCRQHPPAKSSTPKATSPWFVSTQLPARSGDRQHLLGKSQHHHPVLGNHRRVRAIQRSKIFVRP